MDAHTDSELDTFSLLQPLIQVSHSSKHTQPSTYRSLSVIFMGLGIAKIDQKPIPEQLGDMSLVALDNFGTHPLIRTDHVTPVFWVELTGEFGGVHQITE